MTVGLLSEQIGTSGNDFLSAPDNQIIYGLQGNDTLNSTSGSFFELNDAILVGGSGSDRYNIANRSIAVIFDGQGAGDSVVASGVGFSRDDSFFGTINGRHLFFGDDDSEQFGIILDWQQPSNRIESFTVAEGTFSYQEVVSAFNTLQGTPGSGYAGNFNSWASFEASSFGELDFADLGLSANAADAAIAQVSARASQLENPASGNSNGDFNGDGKSDFLWHRPGDSTAYYWAMDNNQIIGGGQIPAPSGNWHVESTADFDRNGSADLLWRNYSTGETVLWYMNGTGIAGAASYGTLSTDWQVGATGDFNNDAFEDIIWRNETTGATVIWYLNQAGQISGAKTLASPPTSWRLVGAGDINGDGRDELFWDNRSSEYAAWFLDSNANVVSGQAITPPIAFTAAYLRGVADMNQDGKEDLIFSSAASPFIPATISYMNGANSIGSSSFGTPGGYSFSHLTA